MNISNVDHTLMTYFFEKTSMSGRTLLNKKQFTFIIFRHIYERKNFLSQRAFFNVYLPIAWLHEITGLKFFHEHLIANLTHNANEIVGILENVRRYGLLVKKR